MRRTAIALMAVAGVMLSTGLVSAEELKFTFKDARITIVAENVTLQEILAEWTRVGHTEFVGVDTLRDQRVTVQLFDVAEAHAIEVLLRSTAGYLARYRTGPAVLGIHPPLGVADVARRAVRFGCCIPQIDVELYQPRGKGPSSSRSDASSSVGTRRSMR